MNKIYQQKMERYSEEYVFENCEREREVPLVKDAYQNGWHNALQNQWISVEEALPPIREKDIENRSWSDWVLIMTHGGGAFMDCYAFHRKEWLNNGNDVTHWMMIPTINKEEK